MHKQRQLRVAIVFAVVIVFLLVVGLAFAGLSASKQNETTMITTSSLSNSSTSTSSTSKSSVSSTPSVSTSTSFTSANPSTTSLTTETFYTSSVSTWSLSRIQATTTVTSALTSSSTTYPRVDAALVRANGYYLSTPLDMMLMDNANFSSFVHHLIQANITYLYFNLPNIDQSGYVLDNYSLDYALMQRFDGLRGNHTFEFIAWTGTQTNPRDVLGNFSSAAITSTVNSIYKANFQGILIDMEPVPNDSPQFLSMLADFKQSIQQQPQKMLLGVNSMKIELGAAYGVDWSWDETYFRNVTSLVDFVAPMLFNTGTSTQYDYEQYVEYQVQLDTQYSVAPILFAIPNWYLNSTWHHPYAENVSSAILAFQQIVSSSGSSSPLPTMLGLGIYGLNRTYILGQGPPTHGLETTPYDWNFFVSQWVNTSYPSKTGSSIP